MVFTLIVILAVIIFLAFFVGKNLTNLCTLWFFKVYENLPVSMLVLIAFGAGIVFSILVAMIYKLKQSGAGSDDEVRSEKAKKEQLKKEKLERKAQKLKESKLRNKKSAVSEKNDDKTIVQKLETE